MKDNTKGKNFVSEVVEFHKWCLVEEGKNRYFHSREEYEMAKAGWKAALEWVEKTTDEHYYAFEDKFDVIKMIKEELNAKT